jgi:predicted aspartyl protease
VISREIADQLGAEAVKRGTASVTVADGRKVTVDVLELPSIEVGRNKAERVITGVMPEPLEGIDGLLGMTFLNHFGFESDPKSGVFYLRRVK